MIRSNSLKQTSRAESSFYLHTHFTPYTAWRRATSLTMKLLKANHFISTLLGWIWILERVSDIITTSRRRICETGFIECYHLGGQLTGDGFTHIRATNRYFSASFPILIASWADLTIWGNFWLLKLKANLNFYSQVRSPLWPQAKLWPGLWTGRAGICLHSFPPPSSGLYLPLLQSTGKEGKANVSQHDWPWWLPELMLAGVGILPRALQDLLTTQLLWCRYEPSPGSTSSSHLLAPINQKPAT